MGWDFKEKRIAEKLSNLAKSLPDPPTGRLRDYKGSNLNQQILVKTPSDGIPARSEIGSAETDRDEYQMGVAECKLLSTYTPLATGGETRNQQALHTVGRPYAGTNETDWRDNYTPVYVSNPYANAITGDKIILAHYIDGSYVVAEPPQSKREHIALKTSIISGKATAWLLEQPTENEGEFAELTVTDPRKQFYGAIGSDEATRNDLSECSADLTYYAEKPGAIGWAAYSPTSDSWEIEHVTLPIQRFKAEVPGGVTAPSDRFSGILNEPAKSVYFNPEDSLSPYPHVDMPPEVMCNPGAENMDKHLMVQALNPHRFTIIPGSEVTIERRIKEVPASEYDATSYDPHDNPEPSTGALRGYEWVIVDAEETIARWARCKIKPGSVTCEWEYDDADYYKEGGDPRAFFGSDVVQAPKDDVPVIPAPGLEGCECDDGSSGTIPKAETIGWAFFDNNDTQYVVATTKSAMLGKPTGTDYIQDVSEGSSSGCSLSLNRTKGMLGWACNEVPDTIDLNISTREIQFIKNIEGGCNVICPRFEYATVLNCGSNTAPRLSCMNIYADPCETCSGNCNWIWDSTVDDWVQDDTGHQCVPDSSDCGCEGSKPPITGSETNGQQTQTPCAVYNSPPEPPPCESCTLCANRDIQIDDVEYSANNPGTGSIYTMVPGTSQRVGDCEWTVDVVWSELFQTDITVQATITFDGTTWSCSVPTSQSGVQGDWTYTSPAPPPDCSPGFIQETDTFPGLSTSQFGIATVTFGASGPLCT